MAEKDFQGEIAASIKRLGSGLYYKLPDPPVSQFGERSRKWAAAGKKPFDCFWCLKNGLFIPMELKQIRGLSMNFGENGAVKPHQEEAGLHLNALGFPALLVVNFQHVYPAKKAKALGVDKVDRVFAVLFSRAVAGRQNQVGDSMPIGWFECNGVELMQGPGRIWDVGKLWDYCQQLQDVADAFPGHLALGYRQEVCQ